MMRFYRERFSGLFGNNAGSGVLPLFGRVDSPVLWKDPAGDTAIGYLSRPDGVNPQYYTGAQGQVTLFADATLYNAAEIAAQLKHLGHDISDNVPVGELLLHMYLEYGPSFACRVNGMFNVAIKDSRTRKLILTRDAVGARSLYYTSTPSHMAFSSTLASLRRWPALKLARSHQKLCKGKRERRIEKVGLPNYIKSSLLAAD
jgi:hypothetical protein